MSTATAVEARRIRWRIFCPSCLDPNDEHLDHVGLADRVQQLRCARCRRSYTVTTGLTANGAPKALATPPFIKKPEVVDDTQPFELP